MKNNITVWEYIDGKIVSLNIDGRKVTAANYGKTKRCLRRFTETDNLFFEDITDDFVSQFNSYLGKTNIQKSTISFYNRVLRSIYNQASKEGVVKNIHPFDGAYTKVEVKLSPIPTRIIINGQPQNLSCYEMGGDMYWYIDGYTDFAGPRSVYFYKERNSKIKAGPVWDFCALFANQVIVCDKCMYYKRLFQDPYFVARVKEKWPVFKTRVEGIDNEYVNIVDYFDGIHRRIDFAAKRDYNMWVEGKKPAVYKYLISPDEQYEIIHKGIIPKLNYLESYINSLVVNYDTKPGGNEDIDGQDDRKKDFDFGF